MRKSDFKTALAQTGMFSCLMAGTFTFLPRILGKGEPLLDYMTFGWLVLGTISGLVWILRVKAATDKEWKESLAR